MNNSFSDGFENADSGGDIGAKSFDKALWAAIGVFPKSSRKQHSDISQRLTPVPKPVFSRSLKNIRKFDEARAEQDAQFNLARKRLPQKAIDGPERFWSSTETYDEFLKANYWKRVSDTLPAKPFRFVKLVRAMLHTCAKYNLNKEKLAGDRTVELKFLELNRFVKELHSLKMMVTTPCLLSKKHMVAYLQAMESGEIMRSGQGAAAKTLQTAHSNISALYIWAGRSGQIVRLPDCVVNPESARVIYEVTEDPRPLAKGVDVYRILKDLTANPLRHQEFLFGWQLSTAVYFGLRVREILRLKPFLDFTQDCTELHLKGKGGRPRVVTLEEDQVAIAKNLLKAMPLIFGKDCMKNFLAPITGAVHPLAANRRAFWKMCTKHGLTKDNLGVTTHAFRKEFAVQEMLRRGLQVMKFPNTPEFEDVIDSAVERRQLFEMERPWTLAEEQDLMLEVAEQLGHGRLVVMKAYARLQSEKSIKKTRRLTTAENAFFRESLLAGASTKELMETTGLSQAGVYAKAKKQGLPTPTEVRKQLAQ
jgi:integrase